MEIKTVKEKDMPKREFAFSQEFPNEIELALKTFDKVFEELTKISSGKITFPEEYGVVNNLYKFRYITPNDIATFASNLIQVLKHGLIQSHITDIEKFSVVSVKRFLEDHDCVPIEHSSIYGLYQYTTDQMTLKDLLVLCENDFYHRTVVSKFEMTERTEVIKKDYQKIADMHFTTNTMKIVDSLPKLITQTDFSCLSYTQQKAVQTYIEEFILFATMLNSVVMSNMIFFCIPRSTYDTKLMVVEKQKFESNDLLDGDLDEDDDSGVVSESQVDDEMKQFTECCLLKTGTIRHVAKIPFDINMRNIVLQDMHPKFKDTVSAIEYITKDTRSPIAQLLFRYGHPSIIDNDTDGAMICKMFINDPCAQYPSYDEYSNKLHGIDFHTDVNWLDKIAYGNSFIDGNYRTDAMGNEHRHPIQQSLDMLYRMFGECQLKTKEELSNHILKIANVMKSIIDIYGSMGIYNWEMVRDILVVLGEIMTRSMIKLYDNHMSLIVSDNMDDVDAPGYMYTEYDIVTESSNGPSIENSNTESGIKGKLKKLWMFIKKLAHKFIAWVQNILSKLGFNFAKNHKKEKEYVLQNESINREIATALKNGTFNPTVKNWPMYNIQNIEKYSKRSISSIIDDWVRMKKDGIHNRLPSVATIKREFYPDQIADKLVIQNVNEFYHHEMDEFMDDEYLYQYLADEYMMEQYEYNQVFQEAVDTTKSKPIYVCFTTRKYSDIHLIRGGFIAKSGDSRPFKDRAEDFVWDTTARVMGSNLVHAAISLDPSLSNAYTYHNKSPFDQTHNGSKDGVRGQNFLHEYGLKGTKEGIIVYTAYLTEESYNKMNQFIDHHMKHRQESSYDWSEIITKFLHGKNEIKDNDFSWICSTFVNAALKKAGINIAKVSDKPAPSQLSQPMLKRSDFRCVFAGPASAYDASKVKRLAEDFANERDTKEADFSDGKIIGPTISTNDEKKNVTVIRNFFLYGNQDPIEPANKLTAETWNQLVQNITKTGTTFESRLKQILEDNENAAKRVQTLIDELETSINDLLEHANESDKTDEYTKQVQLLNRNRILLQAVNEISREYTAVYADCVKSKFYQVEYKLYRDTLSVYKSSKK